MSVATTTTKANVKSQALRQVSAVIGVKVINMATDKQKKEEFTLDNLSQEFKPEEERLQMQKMFRRDKNLVRIFLTVNFLQPATSNDVADNITKQTRVIYDKAKVYYHMNKLVAVGILSNARIIDVSDVVDDSEIKEKILERHAKYISNIPVSFRNNFSYTRDMKYYWLSEYGKTFVEFCINQFRNGQKIN